MFSAFVAIAAEEESGCALFRKFSAAFVASVLEDSVAALEDWACESGVGERRAPRSMIERSWVVEVAVRGVGRFSVALADIKVVDGAVLADEIGNWIETIKRCWFRNGVR